MYKNEITQERANEIAFLYVMRLVESNCKQALFIREMQEIAPLLGIDRSEAVEFAMNVVTSIASKIIQSGKRQIKKNKKHAK